jgi:hypothetical protein
MLQALRIGADGKGEEVDWLVVDLRSLSAPSASGTSITPLWRTPALSSIYCPRKSGTPKDLDPPRYGPRPPVPRKLDHYGSIIDSRGDPPVRDRATRLR